MTDYKQLIEALRYCAESGDFKCGKDCQMHEEYPNCLSKMDTNAAAAIEALQAEHKKTVTQIFGEERQEWEGRCKDLMKYISDLQAEVKRVGPKRGEWVRVQEVDIPGEMHPVAFKCMCSVCRNEYLFPKIPRYCPDCGSMNTAKMEVQDDKA